MEENPNRSINYNGQLMFNNESFDILDSGMAAEMAIPKPEEMPDPSDDSAIARYEEISTGWKRTQFGTSGRTRKANLFRNPDALQTSNSFPAGTSNPDQDFIDETSRAVSSVDQGAVGEEEDDDDDSKAHYAHYQPVVMDHDSEEPSTSQEPPPPRRNGPLERLGLQIGKKILRFKIVEQIAPAYTDPATGKFRCTLCKVCLPTHEDWRKHNRQYHGAQKSFVCVVCGIGFTNKSSLTVHHRSHSGFKSHECNICHKVFSRSTNLIQHIKMHQSGRHHFCELCGRCFKDLNQLGEHQNICMAIVNGEYIHTDKPLRYQCSYCDKMFHHKRDKFIHERIHTGEKPYQCGYCGRGFTQSQGLTIHIRLHTGERPYNCSYCGKQFRDSSSLRKHEFRQHVSMNPMYDGNDMESAMLEDDYSNSIWNGRS